MKSAVFLTIVEPDEERWFARCPALEKTGAATWGYTQAEALKNMQEVTEMVVAALQEDGEPIPEGPADEVQVFTEPRVAVIVSDAH